VAFDESHGYGHRHELYPAYKANREPAPPELKRQFALCREFCRHLGVAEFASPRFEADDLIGTLAERVRAEGLRVTVVTRDKDLAQLVGPGDHFWDYSDSAEYAYEEIAARFGVVPERMADYLALTGDAVDNIPGVPGVGPKTAAALMQRFASLDELYADPDAAAQLLVRGAARLPEKLRTHREAAYLARALTHIHRNAPMQAARADLQRRSPALAELGEFCTRHGFGAMLPRQAERIARLAA
jgi:5'-3' exonuclease